METSDSHFPIQSRLLYYYAQYSRNCTDMFQSYINMSSLLRNESATAYPDQYVHR